MFPRICVSAILPAPPMRAAPLPPVEMDTAPAARCPAEIIRPPGRGRPLLPAAIHPAACCPLDTSPAPGGLLPLDTSPAPAACCPPGHVARDPRRKQSRPNEIKTCCPFAGGDPRRPLPRPWSPMPARVLPPAACRDPRRRSWTRNPGRPCGRACEELPAAWTRRRSCQPSRRAIHPAAILDTSRRPRPRRRSPAACCRIAPTARAAPMAAHGPARDPRPAAPHPWTRGPRATPRAITRALRAPGCNPYGVAFTAQRATPARYASAHPCAPASRAACPRAPPHPCARVAPRALSTARVRARPLSRVGTARVIFLSRGRCDPAISLVFFFYFIDFIHP